MLNLNTSFINALRELRLVKEKVASLDISDEVKKLKRLASSLKHKN